MRKVLLLCTSHNDIGLIRALRKMGYEIVATGSLPGLIGEVFVDKYIQADYSDKELILSIAKEEKINAICQCCNDLGVYTAAYIAEKLNLAGYDSYDTTLLLHNKDKFKEFARKNNIITPEAKAFESISHAMQYLENVVLPVIVKPVDASAGNGIKKITSREETEEAVIEAYSKSRDGRIIVEHFISGTQHGFCTFLINQKVVACCSNNEYSIVNPYRVEIDTFPADNHSLASKILIEQIERIASILKLKDGIFHLQYIMCEGVPYIIEVMRRVLGNMYSIPASLLCGFDWDYWEARAKCGLSCEDFPTNMKPEGFFAYKAILSRNNGKIHSINLPPIYNKYLIHQCMLKKKGDYISKYQTEPIGFLFFLFASENEMKEILINQYDDSIVKIV